MQVAADEVNHSDQIFACSIPTGSGLDGMQLGSIMKLNAVWQDYRNEAMDRQMLLTHIKSEFGYGGFIHNFKNHVLRGQQKYVDRFRKNEAAMLGAIRRYENILQDSLRSQQTAAGRA